MRTIFLLLLFASGASAYGQQEDRCVFGEGTAVRQVAGFQVNIAPYRDEEDSDCPECSAVIRSPNDKIIFSEHDSGLALLLTGDVNGDGIPDVVLEAFSGGAHCCWTYYVVSLRSEAGPLKVFENAYPVSFARDATSGRIEIVTADGAFDYFDGACHPCSPHARVYLRLDGRNLVDVSAEHLADYDQIIHSSRQALTPEDLQKLRALREQPTDTPGMIEVAQNALTMVLAYLYSGREAQAHQELENMWPEYDQERMWELILVARQNGILSYTREHPQPHAKANIH